jgi:hypothetical protein
VTLVAAAHNRPDRLAETAAHHPDADR